MSFKPLMLGQAPGRLGDPKKPVRGSARALEIKCGLPCGYVKHTFDFFNVYHKYTGKNGKGDAFPKYLPKARRYELAKMMLKHSYSIILGKTAASPLLGTIDYFHVLQHPTYGRVVVIPHPSGVNRWWNDKANVRKASVFMRKVKTFMLKG